MKNLAKSTTARSHPSLSLILGIRKIEVLIAVLLTHYLTAFKNLHKNRFQKNLLFKSSTFDCNYIKQSPSFIRDMLLHVSELTQPRVCLCAKYMCTQAGGGEEGGEHERVCKHAVICFFPVGKKLLAQLNQIY